MTIRLVLLWLLVGVPLGWGIWRTMVSSLTLFL
jgi:hypothetical protein